MKIDELESKLNGLRRKHEHIRKIYEGSGRGFSDLFDTAMQISGLEEAIRKTKAGESLSSMGLPDRK